MKTFEVVWKLMKEHDIKKQTDLARIIYQKEKIEPKERVNVSGYLSGAVDFPELALKRMSSYFGVSIDYLLGKDGRMPLKPVPIVANTSCGAMQTSSWQLENEFSYIREDKWNKDLYCVIANGKSMFPLIDDQAEVIINPNVKPLSGHPVFYKLDEESAIKILVVDEEAHMLQFVPINSSDDFKTKTIRMDDEDTLNRLTIHKVHRIMNPDANNREAILRMIGR